MNPLDTALASLAQSRLAYQSGLVQQRPQPVYTYLGEHQGRSVLQTAGGVVEVGQPITNGAIATGAIVPVHVAGDVVRVNGMPRTLHPPQNPQIALGIQAVLIQYEWTAADGRDLDTRTKIIAPPHPAELGWARDRGDFYDNKLWMLWQGDQTANGTENIWVRTSGQSLSLRLRAFWYGDRVGGGFNLNLYAYAPPKPPTETDLRDVLAIANGDKFLPKLGRPIRKSLHRITWITTQISNDIDGDEVGLLQVSFANLNFIAAQ